jgi:uncharacterized protein YndB with AHSA1/START domain
MCRVNEDDVVVRIATTIAAAPIRVWEVLIDLPRYRDWHPNMEVLGHVDGMNQYSAGDTALKAIIDGA